jgi:tripartite motif-containing protein 71
MKGDYEMTTKTVYGIICCILISIFSSPTVGHCQIFKFEWGTAGTGQGQFNQPVGIALDSTGNVFVLDSNRVQKFDGNGAYLTSWQVFNPMGISIDSGDNVYVTNYNQSLVHKYTNSGIFIASIGSGQLLLPTAVAIDSSNNVYVLDWSSSKVNKFSSNGNFLLSWGGPGTANGQFADPKAIGIDASDRIYVGDGVNRIQIFDSNGTYLGTWGVSGKGDGQLDHPMGINFDMAGNLYVTEFGSSRVQKWDTSGSYLTKWGIFGASPGTFKSPYGITVTISGDIYVVDSGNNRVQVFGSALPSTYNASKTWNYSLVNARIVEEVGWICDFATGTNGTTTIVQNGEYVSATIDGTLYSGFVSGSTYNLSAAGSNGIDENESEQFIFTLTSGNSGSGNLFSADTDNAGSYCLAQGEFSVSDPGSGVPGVGGGGGGGGGGCFITAAVP